MQLCILVIDDEPTVLMSVRQFLVRRGHRVETASDGADGVERARVVRPDLILCDSKMPRLSGKETVEELRRDSATAHIPVVIMSGNETAETTRWADAFLEKPFSSAALFATIETALKQGHSLARENQ